MRGINLPTDFDRRDELLGFRRTLVRKSKEYLRAIKIATHDKDKIKIANYVLSLDENKTDNYKYHAIKNYLDKADIIDGFDFIRDEHLNNDFYILINPNDVHDIIVGEEEKEAYHAISLTTSKQTVFDVLVDYILHGEE